MLTAYPSASLAYSIDRSIYALGEHGKRAPYAEILGLSHLHTTERAAEGNRITIAQGMAEVTLLSVYERHLRPELAQA